MISPFGKDWFADSYCLCRDPSIDVAVLEDLKLLKADPYLPKDMEVIGYAYDGATGKVREVAAM